MADTPAPSKAPHTDENPVVKDEVILVETPAPAAAVEGAAAEEAPQSEEAPAEAAPAAEQVEEPAVA